MKSWIKYCVFPCLRKHLENIQIWVVNHLPSWVVYRSVIRAGVHATTGKYGHEEAPGVSLSSILDRWGKTNK